MWSEQLVSRQPVPTSGAAGLPSQCLEAEHKIRGQAKKKISLETQSTSFHSC